MKKRKTKQCRVAIFHFRELIAVAECNWTDCNYGRLPAWAWTAITNCKIKMDNNKKVGDTKKEIGSYETHICTIFYIQLMYGNLFTKRSKREVHFKSQCT